MASSARRVISMPRFLQTKNGSGGVLHLLPVEEHTVLRLARHKIEMQTDPA